MSYMWVCLCELYELYVNLYMWARYMSYMWVCLCELYELYVNLYMWARYMSYMWVCIRELYELYVSLYMWAIWAICEFHGLRLFPNNSCFFWDLYRFIPRFHRKPIVKVALFPWLMWGGCSACVVFFFLLVTLTSMTVDGIPDVHCPIPPPPKASFKRKNYASSKHHSPAVIEDLVPAYLPDEWKGLALDKDSIEDIRLKVAHTHRFATYRLVYPLGSKPHHHFTMQSFANGVELCPRLPPWRMRVVPWTRAARGSIENTRL